MYTEIIMVNYVADFDPVENRLLEVFGKLGCVEAVKGEVEFGELDSTTEFLDDSSDVKVQKAIEIVLRCALKIRRVLDRLHGPAFKRIC